MTIHIQYIHKTQRLYPCDMLYNLAKRANEVNVMLGDAAASRQHLC